MAHIIHSGRLESWNSRHTATAAISISIIIIGCAARKRIRFDENEVLGSFHSMHYYCYCYCCCCNGKRSRFIIYSAFDFVNGTVHALYLTHSVWWIPFKRDTLSRVSEHRPTTMATMASTSTTTASKNTCKKREIFSAFSRALCCNRWWPENTKCCALICTHHVHTHSDQIELAHAQIIPK